MNLLAMVQDPPSQPGILSRLLGIDKIDPNQGTVSLTWYHYIPLWVVVLIVIPAIAVLVWLIYRRERSDVPSAAKWILAGVRTLILLLVFAMLCGPTLTLEIVKFKRAHLLVLVDDSLSMRRSDPPTRLEEQMKLADVTDLWSKNEPIPNDVRAQLLKLSRADIVRKALENPRLGVLGKLEDKLNVAYFTFSKGVRSVEKKDFLPNYTNDTCLGTETAIGESIKQARAMYKGLFVAGVVVISDGRNNLGIDPATVAKELKQQYVPIFTVAAGIPQRMKDIAFLDPEAKQVVRAKNQHQIKFTVRSDGFDGEEIEISLHVYPLKSEDQARDWTIVDQSELEKILSDASTKGEGSEKMVLREGSERQRGAMVWEPQVPGEYLVIVRTPGREGERTGANNHVAQRVRVVDDKIRVLCVDHPPRWEFRYLKNALIRDPKVLVHTLQTSADEGFPQELSMEATDEKFKTPLREFPKTIEELLVYDVIILGDVNPALLGGTEALNNIKRFVLDFSGGLVMISGLMYAPRSFRGTPLEDLLPVHIEDTRETDVYQQEFGYALTDYAKADGGHPVIQFPSIPVGDLPKLIEKWEDLDKREDDLPGVRWFTKARPKPTAQTLVEITGVQGQDIPGKRPPLFVVANTGHGRIFWSATDETHRWRLMVGDYPWFYPFWQQVMYWAMDRKLSGAQRFQLYLQRHDRRYVMGETVLLSANAFSRDFQPLQDPELEINIEPPQGTRFTTRLSKSQDKDGYYEGAFQPREVGAYRIWAGDDDETSRAVEKFVVYIPNREEDEPILDTAQLREIAREGYIGEAATPQEREKNFFPITEISRLPEALQSSPQPQAQRKDDDLWDSPLVYLIFALLITTEWVLRKIFRML
jgi:hypothetical protein